MRHSFSTSNFYLKENPCSMIDWAKKNNFCGMELWADMPHFYVDNVKESLLKEYENKKGGLEFSVHMPIYGVSISSVNPGILKESFRQAKKIINWSSHLPFKIFVLHAGSVPAGTPEVRKIVKDILYRSMKKLNETALKHGVELVIENIGLSDLYWDRKAEDLVLLMEKFNIGLCLDIGHLNLCPDPAGRYDILKKYIKHIHISDNNGINDDHLPVGEGNLNYGLYKKTLRKFKGLIVHEIHAPEDPAGAILRSRENLEKIILGNVSRETFKRKEK